MEGQRRIGVEEQDGLGDEGSSSSLDPAFWVAKSPSRGEPLKRAVEGMRGVLKDLLGHL